MLYLSAAQIESSMREGNAAVHQLADALVAISESSRKISDSIDNHKAADLEEAPRSNEDITIRIKDSVVACQSHDRVSQRLEHVTHALSKVCDLISTPQSYEDPNAWQTLRDEISSGYTMESEKIMFEHIMMGMSVQEALEIYHHKFELEEADTSGDEIELF